MLSLTTPIAIPNVQKVHVDAVQLDSNTNTGVVTCSSQGGGALIYGVYALTVKDGSAQGLRAAVSPTGYTDRVEVFTAAPATAFTDLVAAYGAAGNVAAKNRAVETMMQAAGLLPAGAIT